MSHVIFIWVANKVIKVLTFCHLLLLSGKMKKFLLCTHCDYKTAKKSSIQTHIKSIHEGKTFACTQCDFKATQKGNLHIHIKSIHERQTFACTYLM